MKRLAVPSMCLVIAIVIVGCAKSPPAGPKTPAAKDSGPQAVADPQEAEDVPVAPADTPPTAPADTPPTPPPADQPPATPAVETPSTDSAPAAVQLPFKKLVALLGIEQADQAYQTIEEQLAENPQQFMPHVRLVSLLHAVGRNLADRGNKEKAREAFLAAFDRAKSIPVPSDAESRGQLAAVLNMIGGSLTSQGDKEQAHEAFLLALGHARAAAAAPRVLEDAGEMLAEFYYNGACAQALAGQLDDAKATLQEAVDMGFDDLDLLRTDEDLAALRALPDFDQQLAAWDAVVVERLMKEAQEVLAKGETFPFDFSLTDLNGESLSLADHRGKVVIVDIWGTWCPPCRAEIPSFVQLQTQYGPQGLQIIGLNYEQGAPEAEAKATTLEFIQANGINYPCALIPEELLTQADVEAFPTTIFFDRAGKVRAKVVGAHDYRYLEAIVKALLADAAAPADVAPADTPPADVGAPPVETPPADELPAEPVTDA